MGEDLLANTAKGSASPYQGGISLFGSQKGYHKDAASNEGACVLYLPVDLDICGQKSGATKGTAGKRKRGQVVTTDFPESLEGQHETMGQGSGRVNQSSPGVRPKSGGVEAHQKLVQAVVGGVRPNRHGNTWTA